MSDAVTVNIKGLDQLIKALKTSSPVARVGILGGKTMRSSEGSFQTNAEIGAAHEFGTSKLPIRSFLRVPISENLQKRMESAGAFDKEAVALVVKQGSLIPWVKKIAILAESIVAEAFDSGGFGKWPAWKNPDYTNNAGQLLVDTKQLRDSITSEVKE